MPYIIKPPLTLLYCLMLLVAMSVMAHAAEQDVTDPEPKIVQSAAPEPDCIIKNTGCSQTINEVLQEIPAKPDAENLGKLRVDVAIKLNNTHSMDDKAYLQSVMDWIDQSKAPLK